MFSGVSTLTIDSKGRMAIPAKQRDLLAALGQTRLWLTLNLTGSNPTGSLALYTHDEWLRITAQINITPGTQGQFLKRHLIGNAEEMELDGSGRMLLSPNLRKLSGLTKAVAFVGVGNRFEIWDEERWNALNDAALTLDGDALAEMMQGIVL
ncbi:division/cell wall cluster transcriptional repressor MraZ [Chitinilyticum piscinae]|uniref:Transcriptional regulator MraZ n=1 Tax=Chitinilyticum piscinae TaxID=2866724 RepID=A0A8J7FW31_9NEIS|nr:division/cell wall cluster transcriptional repressor MraZ [Chitinilyticum piscinae]MBE9608045.1 division/cell wall cluster transcriptional repressor MraZ [Chitinilyticum piscinae]